MYMHLHRTEAQLFQLRQGHVRVPCLGMEQSTYTSQTYWTLGFKHAQVRYGLPSVNAPWALAHERTPLNIQWLSCLFKWAFTLFFWWTVWCTCSSAVFSERWRQQWAPALRTAPFIIIMLYNTVYNHKYPYHKPECEKRTSPSNKKQYFSEKENVKAAERWILICFCTGRFIAVDISIKQNLSGEDTNDRGLVLTAVRVNHISQSTHSEGECNWSNSSLERSQADLLQGDQGAGVPDMNTRLQGLKHTQTHTHTLYNICT